MILEGGCFCGALRYRGMGLEAAGYCHCSLCRRTSGAPALAWANTPRQSFVITAGAPRFVRTSEQFQRAFCPDCGTICWSESVAPQDWALVSIHHGTLDRPHEVLPQVHICFGDRLPWFDVRDDLPRKDGSSPG